MKLTSGSIFARDFRITAPLAEGGMGAVYAVEQLSTGKRRALKVMQPALIPDARARERFVQEARIGAQVESEHIVDVVASGIDEQTGMPWIAMELLDGQDLAALIAQRGPMAPADAYELIAQLCDGLGAAHQKGIVHRDLKPENIFIATTRRRGSPFTLKLLDFGIAKVAQPNRTSATGTSAMGSPLWMAPEQTEAGSRLRPATDVWAVGLLAFYVLTGKSYWRSGNQSEIALTPVFTEVLVLPLEPPAVRAAQLGLGHLIPYGFDAWFMRCVARVQEQRFTDASEALRALTPQLAFAESSALRRVAMTSVMPQAETLAPHAYAQATVPREVPQTSVHGASTYPQAAYGAPPYVPSYTPPQVPSQAPPYAQAQQSAMQPYPSQGYVAQPPTYAPLPDRSARLIPYIVVGVLGSIAVIGAGGGFWLWLFLSSQRAQLPPAPVTAENDAGAGVDAGLPDAPPQQSDAADSVGSHATHIAPLDPTHPTAPETQLPVAPDTQPEVQPESQPETPEASPEDPTNQDPFPESGATQFSGHWTGGGWRYRVLLTLARDGEAVSGSIRWTLLETDDELFVARVGESATEVVSGTYDSAGRLSLEGQSVSDDSLINTDAYDLQLAPSGMLTGSAEQGGGRFLARRE